MDEARAERARSATTRLPASRWDEPTPWHQRTWLWATIGALIVLLLTPLAALGWYRYERVDRVYDGVSALGVDLSGMTGAEAERALSARAAELTGRPVAVRAAESEWQTDWGQLGLRIPTGTVVERAMAVGRDGNPVQQALAQLDALGSGIRVPAEQRFDEAALNQFLARVAADVDRPVRDARLELKPDLSVELTSAQVGRALEVDASRRRLLEAAIGGPRAVELAVTTTPPTTTDEMRRPAKERAERILAGPLHLTHADRRWTIERQELAELLLFTGGPGVPLEVRLDEEALLPRLQAIAAEVGQPAQDAKLDWNNGQPKVIQPSREGRELDPAATATLIAQRATEAERTIALPVKVAKPAVDAAQIDKMGLRELIDGATTPFAGSVPQKAHNIRLAASRLHGVVVPPRALFSFNRALGPTTIANGYQTAFGIAGTEEQFRTVPSVAGGICQVATTLFQPVFWSGYQIEERNWHLYWIPAYTSRGVAGLDATVDEEYNLDFQFFNNTDTYLLIQARTEQTNLTFELYGTKPAWEVKVDGPTITDRKPADPSPVHQPEPSLPAGQQIQVEAAREGFTATFVRTVTENGNARTLKIESRYAPSRNVTLVGTGGAPAPAPSAPVDRNRPTPASPTRS